MRYYISDLHFGHASLLSYMDERRFENVEALDEHMIRQWNSRVRHNDEVIILGDFTTYTDVEKINQLLEQLRGKKILIKGNHDYYVKKKGFHENLFQQITPYLELNDHRRKVILSHYPIMCYNGQYRFDENGNSLTYMLYGHVHNTADEYFIQKYMNWIQCCERSLNHAKNIVQVPWQMINCFCMFSNYVPLTLDEWIQVDRERRAKLYGSRA